MQTLTMDQERVVGVDPARLARVADLIDRDIEAGRCDGVSLSVRQSGRTVLEEHRGFADRASGRELADDQVFATMSSGKQFFNTVFLSFVERGLVDLVAPVAEVLPQFGIRGKESITPFHLLTHTGGVQSLFPPLPPEELIKNAAVADHCCRQRPESRPGERITYSLISAHAVMAEMLLEVDGRRRSLTTLLDEELFAPLGMSDTTLGSRPELLERMATVVPRFEEPGFFWAEEIQGVAEMIAAPGLEMPAAAYLTTTADFARFAEMLARGGELDGFRLLSPAMLEWATRNHTGELPNGLFDYTIDSRHWPIFPGSIGVGFFVRGDAPTHGPLPLLASPRTFGGWGAGSTCFWIDPTRDLSFTLLTSGLMADDRHVERTRRLGDAVLAALT
ncbi:MAG TPA: serine hydrolase domain-containing protein [Pseudonocardia sp.]|jgi:CubicO group peptidase (beta-lactamase class C family)|nr:serine hydrolase domain-containing protein [Pseudonocardia sp.]